MQTQTAQLEPLQGNPIAPLMLDPGSCAVKSGSCCGVKSCGPKPAPRDLVKKPAGLSDEIYNKIKNHPCYSEEAHHHYARMHVAVAPACNIQCNYCNRKFDCANESRPGVVSEKLTPEEALRKVLTVASKVQRLSVLGIAGPGDPLANPEKTFRTFDLIARNAPDLKLCLSTNGLRLPDYIDELKKYNIEHVTITINMIDPEIGSRIYPWIFYDHRRITGGEASAILSANQLRGLELLTENGILAKINSVMIPGVNNEHLLEVNRAVNERGAFLHNVMPLISAPEHGTHYGLTGQRGPSDAELMGLQNSLKSDMRLMKHCRQCRADAVGLLGEDRSQEFTMERLGDGEIAYDLNARSEFHRKVEREQSERLLAKGNAEEAIRLIMTGRESFLVAVATKGEGRVNEHFGHVTEFQVYEVSATGIEFVAHRKVENFCQGQFGDAENLDGIVESIRDCRAVFASKIGECPRWDLAQAGIEPVDGYADEHIESAILKYINSKMYL